MDSLSKGFAYHIKVEFLEDISDCYILSQSDFIEEDYSFENKKYVKTEESSFASILTSSQKNICI